MTRAAFAVNMAGPERAWEWFGRVGNKADCYKLQLDRFGRADPDLVRRLAAAGAEVFPDPKSHDIPPVVAAVVRGWRRSRVATAPSARRGKSAGPKRRAARTLRQPRPVAAIAEIGEQSRVSSQEDRWRATLEKC